VLVGGDAAIASAASIVETMFDYPVLVRWLTDADGHVRDVGMIQLAADPRHEFQKHVLAAMDSYNEMVTAVGSPQPRLWITPTESLIEAERMAKLGTESAGADSS
jgi:hypothetical protein